MDKDWKLFDTYIGLYKFYWDLSVKLVIFTLGISGAISAYIIKNQVEPYIVHVLIVPAIFSVFIAWLAHVSAPGMEFAQHEVQRLANELEIESMPTFNSLLRFMFVCKVVFSISSVGIMILWVLLLCP